MSIIRSAYFEKIIPFIDKPLVKVITGIRRCGKSVMMEQIQEYLLNHGIESECILSLNFESFLDERVKSLETVSNVVKEIAVNSSGKKIYLFFDEIQELDGWEKLINSYLIDFNCDIYITGSNAKLLSSELSTYLAGRYIEIKMYPFSFAESFEALKILYENISQKEAFDIYNLYAKMPNNEIKQAFGLMLNRLLDKTVVNGDYLIKQLKK